MKRKLSAVLAACGAAALVCGCTTANISRLHLGMDPDEVQEAIGKPSAIRAAKAYAGGETPEWSQVWEYLPGAFAWNPKTYWVYFENDKVVQWGEPGDFSGSAASAVKEYNPNKGAR